MKHLKPVFAILLLLFLCGCATKTPEQLENPEQKQQEAIFEKAESLFRDNAFTSALRVYTSFTEQYPESGDVPAALFKIGMINTFLGSFTDARAAFARLITGYPDHPLADAAEFERLNTYYLSGDYPSVVREAPNVLARLGQSPTSQICRVHALLGDAYTMTGAPDAALRQFSMAYTAAGETERQEVLNRFEKNIARYDAATIRNLLPSITDPETRGYLLYQLGILEMTSGNIGNARMIFQQLISEIPAHPRSRQAYLVLEEMGEGGRPQAMAVGCLLPLSGKFSVFGAKALRGIELALSLSGHGPGGEPIRLLIRDTGSDPFQAAHAVRELAEEGAIGIIGPIGTAEPAAMEAQRLGIPILIFSRKDDLPQAGDCIFRNFITPMIQVDAITDYTFNTLGVNRYAILYPEEEYGEEFMNRFWDKVLDHGGQVVGVETYRPGETDFRGPIQRLVGLYHEVPEDLKAEEDPEEQEADPVLSGMRGKKEDLPEPIVDFGALFIPDGPANVGLILPQLAYYDIDNIYLLGTNLWHSEKLMELAPRESQGAIFPDGFFAQSDLPQVQAFTSAFEATYETTPDFIDAISYDTATLVFNLVRNPGVQTPQDLKHRLFQVDDFQGVTGRTAFDPSGDAIKTPFLLRIEKNRFVAVEP